MKSLSHVQLLATPWTAACGAPPSMGFSRQEYWSGVPLSSPAVIVQLKIAAQKDDTGNCKLRTHIHILILLPISTTKKVVTGLLFHASYPSTHHILNGICHLFRD